mmetsp:Transcript_9885/g.24699  ORF Transcript_9885/g.24699 Transcript_9885/m.24699 type:complete len:376 (-) Transcript_9885:563-1690(-)
MSSLMGIPLDQMRDTSSLQLPNQPRCVVHTAIPIITQRASPPPPSSGVALAACAWRLLPGDLLHSCLHLPHRVCQHLWQDARATCHMLHHHHAAAVILRHLPPASHRQWRLRAWRHFCAVQRLPRRGRPPRHRLHVVQAGGDGGVGGARRLVVRAVARAVKLQVHDRRRACRVERVHRALPPHGHHPGVLASVHQRHRAARARQHLVKLQLAARGQHDACKRVQRARLLRGLNDARHQRRVALHRGLVRVHQAQHAGHRVAAAQPVPPQHLDGAPQTLWHGHRAVQAQQPPHALRAGRGRLEGPEGRGVDEHQAAHAAAVRGGQVGGHISAQAVTRHVRGRADHVTHKLGHLARPRVDAVAQRTLPLRLHVHAGR